jgi:hypothetical protein
LGQNTAIKHGIELFQFPVVQTDVISMENQDTNYQPGQCNIGHPEVNVRKKFFRLSIVLTLILSLASLRWFDSLLLWIILLSSTFSMIVLWLEIRYRFCIIFGFFSLYNFNRLGNLQEVNNPDYVRKDRGKVGKILIESLLISLAWGTLMHVAGNYLHS